MTNKLFVGGLSYNVDNNQLSQHFSSAGTVISANVIIDRMNGQSKGFGFVEMNSSDEALNAIKTLDGTELDGRNINVKEAKPQENRPSNQGSDRGWDRGGDRNDRGNRNSRGGGRSYR